VTSRSVTLATWPSCDCCDVTPATCGILCVRRLHFGVIVKFIDIHGLVVWLHGLVVSALGIRARGPGFDYRIAPLFHWVATLVSCLLTIACPVSQLQKTGVQKGSFRRLSGYGD